MHRRGGDGLSGRFVATGSVFSTMLIESVITRAAPSGTAEFLVDVGSGDSPYRSVIDHVGYVGIDRRPRGRDALLLTALDGVVRWADSLLGRITWRLPLGAGGSARLRSAVSRQVQRWLAILTSRADRNPGPIDPVLPSPRITRGYVVTATLADRSSPHAG